MSLDRKDLRVYFDPTVHAALLRLADAARIEPSKLAEQIVEQYVVSEVHRAILIASDPDVAGLVRIRPVSTGAARIGQDERGSAAPRRGGRG